jgi:antitoxin (DNA-binding transcriptional repressor) of toxin-antitoxin stability system
MRRVGVKEFRDNATKLLASGETMLIERHGHPVGYFIPVRAEREKETARKALARLGEAVNEIARETGMSEDEVAGLFALRRS